MLKLCVLFQICILFFADFSLCGQVLNELTSYIGIINSFESNHQSKRNIIMIHNTNDKSQTKTKADWLLWVAVVIIIIGVILMLRIDLGNVFLSNGSLPGTSIKEYIHISPFFIVGLILLNIYSAVNGKKTDLDKAKSALAGKIGQKSKDINIVINDNIFHYNSSKYKHDIINICQKYGLKNLVIDKAESFNAHATIIDNVPHIFVGEGLKKDLDDVSLLFVIGHEIGHIYYGDLENRDNHSLIKLTLIIFVVLFWFTRMINFFSPRIAIYIAAIVLLLLIYIDRVFYMSYDNEYYCKQIRELRADRFGFNVSKININGVKEIAGIFENEVENDEPTSVPFFEALLIRLKILPALEDCHPSWKFRVDEMERNKSRTKWGLIDDMYYTWKFSVGIMFNNRWRLK